MPDAEFDAMLARAAEKGPERALADVGLDGEEAALGIRDLRSLVAAFATGGSSEDRIGT